MSAQGGPPWVTEVSVVRVGLYPREHRVPSEVSLARLWPTRPDGRLLEQEWVIRRVSGPRILRSPGRWGE
jgi:hypothetical protein